MLLLFVYNERMKKEFTNDMNIKKSENPSHKHEIPRLNRAIGQLEGIKKMIEEQRYFSDSEIAKEKIMEIKTLLDKMQS